MDYELERKLIVLEIEARQSYGEIVIFNKMYWDLFKDGQVDLEYAKIRIRKIAEQVDEDARERQKAISILQNKSILHRTRQEEK